MYAAGLFLTTLAFCLGPALCGSSDKVEVGFYSEALCPDCLILSNGPLTEAFEKIPDIFILKYVPWGNTRISWFFKKFECQHGKMECVMNTVMACVLHYYPNQTDFWPYLHCVDQSGENQDLQVAEKCTGETKVDWDKINSCQSGDLGRQLELNYANITNQLSPPHEYTPWVTINGKHDPQAEDKGLIKSICKAYKGPNIPAACK